MRPADRLGGRVPVQPLPRPGFQLRMTPRRSIETIASPAASTIAARSAARPPAAGAAANTQMTVSAGAPAAGNRLRTCRPVAAAISSPASALPVSSTRATAGAISRWTSGSTAASSAPTSATPTLPSARGRLHRDDPQIAIEHDHARRRGGDGQALPPILLDRPAEPDARHRTPPLRGGRRARFPPHTAIASYVVRGGVPSPFRGICGVTQTGAAPDRKWAPTRPASDCCAADARPRPGRAPPSPAARSWRSGRAGPS